MATDPNRKTLRHFQCRDYLWETFEGMSGELECSIDYLINEAMRQYARARSYGGSKTGTGATASSPPGARESAPPSVPSTSPSPSVPTPSVAPRPPVTPASAPVVTPPATRPPAPAPTAPSMGMRATPGSIARPQIPPVPSVASAPAPRIPSLSAAPTGRPPPPPTARSTGPIPGIPRANTGPLPTTPKPSIPPPLPSGPRIPSLGSAPVAQPPASATVPSAAPTPGTPTLYALYQGQRYPVLKDEFIIGRGQKSSDLVIRDSNVSRRHAVVVLHNGQYWMVDQQSTNGVEFQGARIDRKQIQEGDVFVICDYEVVFTYQ